MTQLLDLSLIATCCEQHRSLEMTVWRKCVCSKDVIEKRQRQCFTRRSAPRHDLGPENYTTRVLPASSAAEPASAVLHIVLSGGPESCAPPSRQALGTADSLSSRAARRWTTMTGYRIRRPRYPPVSAFSWRGAPV